MERRLIKIKKTNSPKPVPRGLPTNEQLKGLFTSSKPEPETDMEDITGQNKGSKSKKDLHFLLWKAVEERDHNTIKQLIGLGVNLETGFGDKNTAVLMLSAWKGYSEITDMLIDAGAELEAKDNAGWTAIIYGTTAGKKAAVQSLISAGAKVNARFGDKNTTVLMLSAWKGYSEITDMLIDAKAELEAKDNAGWTAVWWAVWTKHPHIVNLLVGAGADVDSKNKDKEPMVIWATLNQDIEAIQLLIDAGADVNAVDEDGYCALRWTIAVENEKILQLLIDAKAELEAKDADGWTILMHAVLKENERFIQLLIDAGADVNAVDEDGDSVLDLMQNDVSKKIVNLLKKNGAKPGWSV